MIGFFCICVISCRDIVLSCWHCPQSPQELQQGVGHRRAVPAGREARDGDRRTPVPSGAVAPPLGAAVQR